MYAKYFGTNIVIYLPNTVPTTTTISLWKTKVQYLEVKDAVFTWRGAPDRYLEVKAAVLTCRGAPD